VTIERRETGWVRLLFMILDFYLQTEQIKSTVSGRYGKWYTTPGLFFNGTKKQPGTAGKNRSGYCSLVE
jgi:hypothetical protein